DLARVRRDEEARRQHAILSATFDEVAELDEYRLAAGVLNLELAHVHRLVDNDAALGERLLECPGRGTGAGAAANKIYGKVLMREGGGDRHRRIGRRGGSGCHAEAGDGESNRGGKAQL